MRIHFIFSGMDVDMARYWWEVVRQGMARRDTLRAVQEERKVVFVIWERSDRRRDMIGEVWDI